jgi:putative restriction endonuclease
MPITFENINKGTAYSRHELAELWGYSSFHAIARGVVTPKNDNKIVLFVTKEKQATFEQYSDRIIGNILEWEGPTDHFAEDRILKAKNIGDEIHLFYRERHHMDFIYQGYLKVIEYRLHTDKPSRFKFEII